MVPHPHQHPCAREGDTPHSTDEAADVLQQHVGRHIAPTLMSLVVDRAFIANVIVVPEWCDEVAILDGGGGAWEDFWAPVRVRLTEGEDAIVSHLWGVREGYE